MCAHTCIYVPVYIHIYVLIQAYPPGRSRALTTPVEAPSLLRRSPQSTKGYLSGSCAAKGCGSVVVVRVGLRPERHVDSKIVS